MDDFIRKNDPNAESYLGVVRGNPLTVLYLPGSASVVLSKLYTHSDGEVVFKVNSMFGQAGRIRKISADRIKPAPREKSFIVDEDTADEEWLCAERRFLDLPAQLEDVLKNMPMQAGGRHGMLLTQAHRHALGLDCALEGAPWGFSIREGDRYIRALPLQEIKNNFDLREILRKIGRLSPNVELGTGENPKLKIEYHYINEEEYNRIWNAGAGVKARTPLQTVQINCRHWVPNGQKAHLRSYA